MHSAARDLREGIDILETLNLPHDLASMNNNLGIVNFHLRHYDRAIQHYETALAIKEAEEVEDFVFLGAVLSNMGEVYAATGNLAKALEVTYRSYELERRIGNPANIALSLFNLGEAYSKVRDFQQSYQYFMQALAMQREYNFEWEKSGTLQRLAADSLQLERLPEALNFLQEGLLLAYRLEADVLIRDFYELLARYFHLLEDHRLARHFTREHQRMKELTSAQGLEDWRYSDQPVPRRSSIATLLLPDPQSVLQDGVQKPVQFSQVHWIDRGIFVAILVLLLSIISVLICNNYKLNKSLTEARMQLLRR